MPVLLERPKVNEVKEPQGFEGTWGEEAHGIIAGNNPLRYIDPDGLKALSYDAIASVVASNNSSGQSNELIICLIWKESGFDPMAQSRSSSARGLMQVTKAAAKDVGANYDNLFDPATNVSAGSSYLGLRIKWAGNVTGGLNGYGTGPGYADSILQCEKCLKGGGCGKNCFK